VRIAAAFGKHAIAVDPVTAQRRSNAFYRASGMAWASLIG
jgi:hypothetical protein